MEINQFHSDSNESLKQDLSYPFAKTADGKLIMIENANPHEKYFCCGCEKSMYARLGDKREHHFYHHKIVESGACSFETALHNAFKTRLFQRIETGLKHNRESVDGKTRLMIQWHCDTCKIQHQDDLLKPITDAKMETYIEAYRPDISLYREDGFPYAVIEIECSHALEDEPRQYYNNNKIGIIEFKPLTREDLNGIDADPVIPYSSNLCQFMIGGEDTKRIGQEEILNDFIDMPVESPTNNFEIGQRKGRKGFAVILIIALIGIGYYVYKNLTKRAPRHRFKFK